jgi:hypothetical protein
MSKDRTSANIATGNARVGLQVDGDVVITGGIRFDMPGNGGMTIQVGGQTLSLEADGDDQ